MVGLVVDALDRRIIRALQIDARAPSSALARVLEVSDQTVARRISRLRSTGVVRVVGAVDTTVTGQAPWVVRVKTRPGAALPVARALARRPDTSWVRVLAGGTEVVFTLQGHAGGGGGADLVSAVLPDAPHVLAASAQLELHVYQRGTRSLPYLSDALTPGQHRAVEHGATARGGRPWPPEDDAAPARGTGDLDEVDLALLSTLRHDGRTRVEAMVMATGAPASTVRRRLGQLRSSGALRLDVEVDHRTLGRPLLTHLWVSVEPAQLERAGAALAGHPEVAFAAATTGRTNLYACVLAADARGLHEYLTCRLASVTSLRDVEAVPVAAHVEGAGAVELWRGHR